MQSNPNGYDYLKYQTAPFLTRTITQTNGYFEIDCCFEVPKFVSNFTQTELSVQTTVS